MYIYIYIYIYRKGYLLKGLLEKGECQNIMQNMVCSFCPTHT